MVHMIPLTIPTPAPAIEIKIINAGQISHDAPRISPNSADPMKATTVIVNETLMNFI